MRSFKGESRTIEDVESCDIVFWCSQGASKFEFDSPHICDLRCKRTLIAPMDRGRARVRG